MLFKFSIGIKFFLTVWADISHFVYAFINSCILRVL